MRVLVVDDDPIVRDLMKVVLEQESYDTVHMAASAAVALDILTCHRNVFDVLVLDIAMPEMDGISLCREIRKLPAYERTPIIMLTAKSDIFSVEGAFAAGANDYITKPFDVKGIDVRIQIAERMMRETRASGTSRSKYHIARQDDARHGFASQDAVHLPDVQQHTDPFSLGNYLAQLTRERLNETSVFAVQIEEFERLYQTETSLKLVMVLSEVWQAITIVADNPRMLGAYFGSGSFMCIVPDDIQDKQAQIERRIAAELRRSRPLIMTHLVGSVSIALGRPIRPNASKTKRVRTTFSRAQFLLHRRLQSMEAAKAQ